MFVNQSLLCEAIVSWNNPVSNGEIRKHKRRFNSMEVKLNIVPDGRELLGMDTLSHGGQGQNLVSALLPLSERYPMPFYRTGEMG